MNKFFFIITVLALFSSCKDIASEEPSGNNYYFENPQPINDSELSKMPNKFLGLYMSSDSVYLDFKENMILKENFYRFKISKKSLDSIKDIFEIRNGKFISKSSNEIFESKSIGDSIELSDKNIDTLFMFSNTQKAKRINGHLVLNEKDSIFWRVKWITLDKKILKITQIYSEEDLKKMDSITKIQSKMIDSTSFIINPSRREFKNIFELKNIGFEQQFRKI
jgi:hypothetical protein